MNVLTEIADSRRRAVEAAMAVRPASYLRAAMRSAPPARPFHAALAAPGLSLIAEVKRQAPSVGALRPDADAGKVAGQYASGGAQAISVLTEPDYFGGTLADLDRVRSAQPLPVLRKDFIVDTYQLLESRVAAADAVLLIVALLGESLLDFIAQAQMLELACLVEVHDEAELEVALDAGAEIIGINNRDLQTLDVDLSVTERLAPRIPERTVIVGESGISSPADAQRLAAAGADAILVGSALMRETDPAGLIAELRQCRTSRSVA